MAKTAKTLLAVAVLTLGLAMLESSHKAHAASTVAQGAALLSGDAQAAGDLGAAEYGAWVLDSNHDTQCKAEVRADQLRQQGYVAAVKYEHGLYYVWRWQP
jgi:hypothetical protein